jgi:ribosomal protein L6P/L9E
MLNKTFIIPFKATVKLLFVSQFKFLILEVPNFDKKYFYIPKKIKIKLNKKKIQLSVYTKSKLNSNNLVSTIQLFKSWVSHLRALKKKCFKTVLIRGIGLKISFLETNSQVLQLKLGFSHLIYLTIPKSIQVLVLKKKLIIQGQNATLVGNFSRKIMNFKKINIFTGKGLWLKNIQKFYCKPVKKR